MIHILRRITDLMNINLRIEHQTETVSQLADPIHNHNLSHLLTIDLNSRIIFLPVLRVDRKRMMNRIRMREITTIQEQINGVVNLIWSIKDRIHRMQVLALMLKLPIQGLKLQITLKIHIKIRHLILRTVKNIRKISMTRLVEILFS